MNRNSINRPSGKYCDEKKEKVILSPPDMASPRNWDESASTSGTASWSNVVRFAEDHNRLMMIEKGNSNMELPFIASKTKEKIIFSSK